MNCCKCGLDIKYIFDTFYYSDGKYYCSKCYKKYVNKKER